MKKHANSSIDKIVHEQKDVAGEAGSITGSKKLKDKSFPIIGIGGSAGSFKALERFFMHMPLDSGMALVIVMHLDPNHSVSVAELLQKYTAMPVLQAEDNMEIEQNHAYVIPPNRDMGIHNGKLLLFNLTKFNGHQMPIDYFLQSLAEDQWNNAVAIILSGMGTDGETGVKMIKEKLGMAMAQEPDDAEYNNMPKSAINSGMVDYVLTPEEMPAKMIKYLNHPLLTDDNREQAIIESKNSNAIQKILMLLRSHTGHDFTLYKKNTITRRIDRRIAYNQLPDYINYVNFLRENPHEIDVLFNELLIGVTKFFRDQAAFESLKEKLNILLSQKNEEEPIRIWVAGCSTGEEAYSIAILVIEYLDTLKLKRLPKAQIFATDLDSAAIDHARMGVYYDNIVADVSPERLERFFVKRNNSFSVKKELREIIVFAQHNLIKDAPFTRLDLLCCRNVMIYLTTELQKKILPVFHYSLGLHGILFMGPSETIGSFADFFNTLDGKWKIFERKPGISAVGKMIDFPFNISSHGLKNTKIDLPAKQGTKTALFETFSKILLEQFTPASVLIDEKGDILYINGKTGKFLEVISGEAVMNIHRMAREELKYLVGNAIHQVFINKNPVEISNIKLKEEGKIRIVNFKATYLEEIPLQGLALIVFEDRGLLKKASRKSPKVNLPATEGMVEELEKELIYTKQQLHSTIEQMETSLEELKSTNEELQSTNEELQSTNEESLTTKEEMQSLNEELMTINMQYQVKGEELTQLNNDMKNLLDSTETATIFLDNSLNILRFTPQVRKLFNVIHGDIGRSITHVVSNFDYPAVENDIMDVIESLKGKELEIKTRKDEWYNLRIMPYRTLDNFINGAVLTFNKITPVKAMENKLLVLQKYAEESLELLKEPALLLDEDLVIQSANKAFLDYFKLMRYELSGQPFLELAHNKWQTNKLDVLLEKSMLQSHSLTLQHNFPVIGIKKIFIKSHPSIDQETGRAFIILITLNERTANGEG
ncbi:MAG: two-component system, chemotaxis family, CheB/CheR fusion protein [Mucilaginibacter sp.]|nr:two-component system, chemotaxis family, CheB/CheR fusion protein [Mucilaginibacter sp.]